MPRHQTEHMVAVFYLPRYPRKLRDCLALILETVAILKGPAARLTVRRKWPHVGPDVPWKSSRDKDRIVIPGLKGASDPALRELTQLPNDVEGVVLEANRGRQNNNETAWSVIYAPQEHDDGAVLDYRLIVSCDASLLRTISPSERRVLMQHLVVAVSQYCNSYYGHIEIGPELDLHAGLDYTTIRSTPLPSLCRRVNRAVWGSDITNRHALARGVYWGNFFGKDLATTLEREGVISRFETSEVDLGRSGKYVVRLQTGAVFLAVSDDVMDWSARDAEISDTVIDVAAWLHCALREARSLA